ncbi:hypothetical protein FB639_000796 [Coemansia asiatica]|nr:hypothetical protein FB639_000796 [Coemansia asiatica]
MQNKEQSQATERKRTGGLKRWLSFKNINATYRRSEVVPPAENMLSKEKRKLVRSRNRASEQIVFPNHRVTVKATKIDASSVNKKVSAKRISHTDSQRENDLLMLLLQRELKSPKVSPAAVPELLSPDIAQQPLASLTEESEHGESDKIVSSTSKPKSNPPRRKRSLIYAMYCTAKSEELPALEPAGVLESEEGQDTDFENAGQQPLGLATSSLIPPVLPFSQGLDRGSQSMDTIDNGSTAFVSRTSMPSLQAGYYSSMHGQNGLQQAIACPHKASIKSVLADVAAELSISASRPTSLIDSEGESEYVTGSDISSRSSFVDAVAVEAAAYRCSGRFAPRLSTIERGKDGHLLIKPKGADCTAKSSQTSSSADLSPKSKMLANIAKAECAGAIDSGNESATDTSPLPETPSAIAKSLQSDHTRTTQYAVEGFPSVPEINVCSKSHCIAAREPKDSMLINAHRFSADLGVAKCDDALLSASLDDLVAKISFASNGISRPRSNTSPPSMLPENTRSTTENISVDTAETAKADSTPVILSSRQQTSISSLSGGLCLDKSAQPGSDSVLFTSLSEMLAENKRPRSPSSSSLSSLSSSPSLSKPLSPSTVQRENSLEGKCDKDVEVAAAAEAAAGIKDSQPGRGLRSRHQISVQRGAGLGRLAEESLQSTNSNMLSIFSDISDSDMLYFNGSQTQQEEIYFKGGQFSQLSLFFDGRPHSLVHDSSLISAQSSVADNSQHLNNNASATASVAPADSDVPLTFAFSDLNTNRDSNRNGDINNNDDDDDNDNDDDDDDDDELALSDIIAINQTVISPPPAQFDGHIYVLSTSSNGSSKDQTEVSRHVEAVSDDVEVSDSKQTSSIANRTRKLSTALGSIRNLHRKIKSSTSQTRSTSSSNSRGRSRSRSSTSASGNQNQQQEQLQKQATKKMFRFNELVAVYETWNRDEYDRKGMPSTKLDAEIIEQIKYELNEFKVYEMQVHEDSRRYTHFIY